MLALMASTLAVVPVDAWSVVCRRARASFARRLEFSRTIECTLLRSTLRAAAGSGPVSAPSKSQDITSPQSCLVKLET